MMNRPSQKVTACFKTIGCRLNQAETAQMTAQFEAAGFHIVEAGHPCDIAVINTCTITQAAERDCARWGRRLRRQGARRVVLAGCAVEHNATDLQRSTQADLVVGQKDKFRLPQLLHQKLDIPFPGKQETQAEHLPAKASMPTRGMVKVQDGCNFNCSYCIVPSTRGKPSSRPLEAIVEDVVQLTEAGYREVFLTGANLGCYQTNHHGLVELLAAVESIPSLVRFRIGSIECTTVERDVIDYMATSEKLCHFLHLPMQSGDDFILKQMRRRYSATQYRATVEYAVKRMPNLGLGTDIITGFPGEDESAFAKTVDMVKSLPFSNLHVFSYSPRKGTAAFSMPHAPSHTTAKQRTMELIAMGREKHQTFAQQFIGQPLDILIEKSEPHGESSGWTPSYLYTRLFGTSIPVNAIVTCVPDGLDQNGNLLARKILSVDRPLTEFPANS